MMRKFVGLDGIKGLALVAIVAYHCTQGRLPGGFYGVDVFFTVAGFVMAASMFRKLFRKGKLNYVRYAQRRLARLYPALLLAVTAMVTFAGLFDRDALVNIFGQVLSSLTGWYNWHAIIGGQSYFDQLTPQLLRHLWFVGVLLQFYVVLPFVVWVMWRLRATKVFGRGSSCTCRSQRHADVGAIPTGRRSHACVFWYGHALHWPDAGCGIRMVRVHL